MMDTKSLSTVKFKVKFCVKFQVYFSFTYIKTQSHEDLYYFLTSPFLLSLYILRK